MIGGQPGRRATLLITGSAFFMVLLDTTIVTVTLPSVQRDIGAGLGALGWVVTGYALPFAAMLLPAGTLGDRYGRRQVFLVGLAVFTLGSALCALANGLPLLVTGRAVQGVGGAALGPASLALVAAAYPNERQRVRALGVWSAFTGAALPAGPVIGGLLLTATSNWRVVFAVNVPIGVITLIIGARALRDGPARTAARLDIAGLILSVGALAPLVFGLSYAGSRGWSDLRVLGCLTAGIVLLPAFLIRQSRARYPMLPLRLFRDRLFDTATAAAFTVGFVLTSHTFFLAQFFQDVQGLDPLASGLRTLPTTVAMAVTAPVAGRLAARFGYRMPVALGCAIGGAALLTLLRLQPDTAYSRLWWDLALLGAGFGLTLSPLIGAVLAAAPPELSGAASAVNNVARQLGGTIGIAALTTAVTARTATGLRATMSPENAGRLAHAGATAARATGPQGIAVGHAFTAAIHVTFIVNAALLLLTATASAALLTRRRHPIPDASPAHAIA
ncbi:MFS transporter [Micromonospora mirobrigensis]|uniref:MFS transporter, DHA2 family, methylenomycin A resistance protein n=1 Tax=Micromonospora mirobrigensis TaxID=262898 RepID=A0A1C5AKE1_9ACTN|nr:MFS transporter [Micromonospora mirobrigensis]SCF45695.1 MFS transporter, DHA2 family, methylenomycin A resistance protein [Micromonospora mirobrigensis]